MGGSAARIDSNQTYSIDGIKLITPSITAGDDASSFGQPEYTLATDRRLLLRFESLRSHIDAVRLDGGRKVELRLTLARGQASALTVCPLLRSWMMLATWQRAHPIGRAGEWDRDGGDMDESGCVTGVVSGQNVLFNLTGWFVDYVRGRGVNHGVVVLASEAVTVVGETSGGSSPRMLWVE